MRGRSQRAARACPPRAPVPGLPGAPRCRRQDGHSRRRRSGHRIDAAGGSARLARRKPGPARRRGTGRLSLDLRCDARRRRRDGLRRDSEPFYAVGLWYDDFGQTTDDEVRRHLARAESRVAVAPPEQQIDSPSAVPAPSTPSEIIAHAALRCEAKRPTPIRCCSDSMVPRSSFSARRRHPRVLRAARGHHPPSHHGTRIQRRGRRSGLARRLPDQLLRRGESDDPDAETALGDFHRFPRWMWRNADVVEFVQWLRDYNDALPPGQPKTGFYGIDLYSLSRSIEAVVAYLDKVDPDAAARARAVTPASTISATTPGLRADGFSRSRRGLRE